MEPLLERYRWVVFSLLVLVLAAGLLTFALRRPGPVVITVLPPPPTPTATPTPTPAPLRVYVSGAVHHPDVYVLPPGSLVRDALEMAGGPTAEADLEAINLALQLADQMQVHVPRRGENPSSLPLASHDRPTSSRSSSQMTHLVNINTAPVEELQTLPRIGPTIAQRIVAYREENGPFERPEDLMKVKGIGPTTFEALRDQITVGP
ncbi:MAG: hypothetical protein D6759_11800 [Chloroflexi bacterium]|nr:MAG: hypothetical protein D6759_11800 [Chloroflexota bacterium]